ncbi:MAG: AAA family ATPase [Deltaproteobacteria bacterium]|nr:AAA family ATPase [Deltaproteobacteria bacterium]MBW2049419.1 AAA family ATPase [Deltaproteobacteria bacterium]MBW2112712.1 AAA family ATPase [Deltaproteobacteria bacterium]HDZ91460.1 AAA family ATPase [Deltaproteobacteria bacterium]
MHLNNVTLLYEKYPTEEYYPFNLQVLRRTRRIEFHSPVTFFVGENGTGKSTLLKALCQKCGIHIWKMAEGVRLETNLYEETLYMFLEVQWSSGRVPGSFFGSETFRDFAQCLDEWAAADPDTLRFFGGKSLITQSHGQSLMTLFKARYRIKGLYFLDEPETALSPKSQLELLKVLKRMGEAGHAQFIIATHSPILLACPGADILSFDEAPVRKIDYEDTEHYLIYKNFMENRGRYLKEM